MEAETIVPGSGLAEVIHHVLSGEGNVAPFQCEELTDDGGSYRVEAVSELKTVGTATVFLVMIEGRHFEITVQEL